MRWKLHKAPRYSPRDRFNHFLFCIHLWSMINSIYWQVHRVRLSKIDILSIYACITTSDALGRYIFLGSVSHLHLSYENQSSEPAINHRDYSIYTVQTQYRRKRHRPGLICPIKWVLFEYGGSATILYYYSTPETDSRMTKLQVNRKSSGSGGELPLSRSETSLCTNDVYTIIIRKTKIARKKVPWWRDHLSRDKIRYWWKTNFFPLIEVNIFSANSPTSFELSKWSLAGVELDVFLYGARRHAVCDVWLYWLSLPKKNDQILFSRLELFYTAYEVDSACWIRNSFCTL